MQNNESHSSSFQSYAAEADLLAKQADYKKAIEAYTKALSLKANDKNCLVARCKCFLQIGDSKSALQDADDALKEDPEFFKAKFQKAEALYLQGDFEMALVYYHRGNQLRPEMEEFRLGIQKAREAIDNAIGKSSNFKETKKELPPVVIKGKSQILPKTPPVNNSEKQLLGELYADKAYMDQLMEDKEFIGNPADGIYDIVKQGMDYLNARTEFWRQQKPIYARKKEQTKIQAKVSEARARQAEAKKKEDEKKSKFDRVQRKVTPEKPLSQDAKKFAGLFKEMNAKRKAKELEEALQVGKKLIDSVTEHQEFEEKGRFMTEVYHSVGLILSEQAKAGDAHLFLTKALESAKSQGLQNKYSAILGDLGRVAVMLKDFKEAIRVWDEKLNLTTSDTEKAWLNHDIGRCYLELGESEKASTLGNASLTAAKASSDRRWVLQARVLMAQSFAKGDNKNNAREEYEAALQVAKRIGDTLAMEGIQKELAAL